jgi:hypothetical protein
MFAKWRKEMANAGIPLQHDEFAPEREGLWLLEAIEKWSKLSSEKKIALGAFFSSNVHDSVAGFIGKTMPEFELNGYGIAKFRRIFFGNSGDLFLRADVINANASRRGNLLDGNGKPTQPATQPPAPGASASACLPPEAGFSPPACPL